MIVSLCSPDGVTKRIGTAYETDDLEKVLAEGGWANEPSVFAFYRIDPCDLIIVDDWAPRVPRSSVGAGPGWLNKAPYIHPRGKIRISQPNNQHWHDLGYPVGVDLPESPGPLTKKTRYATPEEIMAKGTLLLERPREGEK